MLMGAAAFAVGALSASAQTVYSVNVVGYVNTVIPGTDYANTSSPGHPQYTLIYNPLDNGTGNHIQDLFAAETVYGGAFPANAALGNTAYTFNYGGQAFSPDQNNSYSGVWGQNASLPPGTGFFMLNGNKTYTNTFVGTVLQGNQANNVAVHYNLTSSIWPAGDYLFNLGLSNVVGGDTIYLFNQHGQAFSPIQVNSYGTPFTAETTPFNVSATLGPFITNGVSFFYLNNSGAPIPWATDFTVH
jgi:hypothetical protein